MAYIVSDRYKQIIYSGDARNKLKLLFNNVELQDADRYCEKLTIKSRIIPNGAKIFSLNNFISKEVELILHDIDTSIIQDQISISIGTLVGNSYEYVPIGIFNIQDTPTNDKRKTTIKLRDNSVKFDFNYNAQELIEENGGSATKLQILQDICSQASVTCNITSFIGYLDEIGVYDNTVTAREYISRIAEQAGKIATINRSGELIFVDLNNLTTWEIPIEIVEKYENGTSFKIGQVVYEDGIVRYETPTSTDDTLFLDGSNNYISGELVKEQASSSDNSYYLENTGEADLSYFGLEGNTTQETRNGIIPIDTSTIVAGDIAGGNQSIRLSTRQEIWLDVGTYTFSCNITSPFRYAIQIENVGAPPLSSWPTMILDSGWQTSSTLTYTFTLTTAGWFVLALSKENNANIQVSEVVDFSYQLDSGGMPSPDHPSELVSVGYENIFNFIGRTSGGITSTYNNGIVLNGTASSTWFDVSNNFAVNNNYGTYTISVDKTLPFRLSFVYSNGNNQTIYKYINKGTTSLTFTDSYGIKSGHLTADQLDTTTFEDYTFNFMLEKGVDEHSYIPYGKYGIEVKTTGKNLFNYADTASVYPYTISCANVKPNTSYYAKVYNVTGTYTGTYAVRALVNGSWVAWNAQKLTDGYSFTTPDGCTKIGFNGLIDTNVAICQVEEGTQPTTYEPYKSNTYLYTLDQPLRSIGDIKDLLYIKNGYLYVDRKIGSVVLNGSETITYELVNNLDMFKYQANDMLQGNNIDGLSNYYTKQPTTSTYKDGLVRFGWGNKQIYFYNDKSRFNSSIDNFKSWLSTHNTEVQYVLATPSLEELGVIEVPKTYEGTTYIDISSNIDTNTYLQYREDKTQVEAILNEVDEFDIDSLKTGKILGNPAIDSYDLIQIHDKSKNLFNINGDILYASSGSMTIQNNVLDVPSSSGNGSSILFDKLYNGDTYTLSFERTRGATVRMYVRVYDENGNNQNNVSIAGFSSYNSAYVGYWKDIPIERTNVTFTILSQYNFRLAFVYMNFGITNIQLEKNNYATDYVPFKDETYTTLATNDLVYTGVLINTFDTQIGEEAKEQNVFVNGEETFKKWARTKIDNVEGTLTLQAGEINEANGRINETNLRIDKDGALLNVIANNSNIDIDYDSAGNPISGEVREVTTTTGFKFNAEGMTIEDTSSNFKAQHRNTGVTYYDGTTIVGQYTKDGSKQKDLELFGVYYYGKNDLPDTPMFVAQLYTDKNGEECFGHFYNRGD